MPLSQATCAVCRDGDEPMAEAEVNAVLTELPQWSVVVLDGIMQLQREFGFDDFVTAQEFVNKVGGMAETQDHHPAILLEWGKVQVNWWSHTVKGLHINDFICAAKCDELFTQ
jgi:4a-hydroxytetrahydrobiopterin dehydratase